MPRALVAPVMLLAACAATLHDAPGSRSSTRAVLVVVWDGLRPDAISVEDTPNLVRLRQRGTEFLDHHATYPTFTMMNAASLATGAYPEATGYFGNVSWSPGAHGDDSAGRAVDFDQPVFSEDYAVLDDLQRSGPVLGVGTLFAAAQVAGISTAAVGKGGPAYLQDLFRGGALLDEKTVLPLALARRLQAAGVSLPPTAPRAHPPGALVLAADNGNPVEVERGAKLKDGVSSDPDDTAGSRYRRPVEYVAATYADHLLPMLAPRLSVLWLRDPDSTQHWVGPGTPDAHAALRSNDAALGRVLAAVDREGRLDDTDVIVVSDHGHSSVSGPPAFFPLAGGHAASGMVRLADLLRRAGFTAFDGLGCTNLPVAMGIRADGTPLYPAVTDADGSTCGKPGTTYQIPAYPVPRTRPPDSLVVAVNGGSDYIYVPEHDANLVRRVVRFLQERSEIGAIFVDDRYGEIAGTMPLSAIRAHNLAGRNPDLIVGYDFDPDTTISGVPGIEWAGILSGNTYRGMHGSFSPRDVHNTLIAAGPDFRAGWQDPLPSANVDVAPTIAMLLGLSLPDAAGRPLVEALQDGRADQPVTSVVLSPRSPATGLTVRLPTDPDGKDVAANLHTYSFDMHMKILRQDDRAFTYYDLARARRW